MKSRISARWVRASGAGSAALLLAALCLPAAAQQPAAAPAGSDNVNVKFAATSEVGGYLSAPGLRTLYVHARDYKGTSECEGACAERWPPFHKERVVPGNNVPDLFGTITRGDGKPQTTFRGWPLYLFGEDKRAEVKGDGAKDLWFVAKVPFYTVMTAVDEKLGTFLVGPEDRALYVADNETTAASACEGDCLKQWRPFHVFRLVRPASLPPGDFQSFVRADGERQIAYRGRPLYWFKSDAKMGDARGAATKGWSVATAGK